MADLRLTPAARAHLLDIWAYTAEQWGQEQADLYLRGINAAFARLARNPRLGSPRPEVAPGYHCLPSGKHVIFYTLSEKDEYINVIGVLHARMDIRTHLE